MDKFIPILIAAGTGAILTFLATWFWKHRDKVTKTQEERDKETKDANKLLANELAAQGKEAAQKLEDARKVRSEVLEAEHKLLVERIELLERTIVEVTTQVKPLWAAVQAKIARDLTHPSPQFQEMDDLLKKLNLLDITDEERVRLGVLLDERIVSTDPEVSEDEKDSARLMKGVMEKVIGEAAHVGGLTELQIVGEKKMPSTTEESK